MHDRSPTGKGFLRTFTMEKRRLPYVNFHFLSSPLNGHSLRIKYRATPGDTTVGRIPRGSALLVKFCSAIGAPIWSKMV